MLPPYLFVNGLVRANELTVRQSKSPNWCRGVETIVKIFSQLVIADMIQITAFFHQWNRLTSKSWL